MRCIVTNGSQSAKKNTTSGVRMISALSDTLFTSRRNKWGLKRFAVTFCSTGTPRISIAYCYQKVHQSSFCIMPHLIPVAANKSTASDPLSQQSVHLLAGTVNAASANCRVIFYTRLGLAKAHSSDHTLRLLTLTVT